MMSSREPFHCCLCNGIKRVDKHWLLWGRPRSRFPLQGMVGPDWRVGAWTFCLIPSGTIGWACLILFGAPDDGSDTIRTIIVAIGAGIALLAMVFYLCTACTDPGIVFKRMAGPPTNLAAQHHLQHQHHPSVDGGDVREGFAHGSIMAPAGAGTPVPPTTAAAGSRAAKSGAAVVAEGDVEEGNGGGGGGGGGGWKMEDAEAHEMLKILTEDYEEGAMSSQIAPPPPAAAAAAAAGTGNGGGGGSVGLAGGLPPEACAAAVDGGSTAVADMRNAPPPDESSSNRAPALPAETSTALQVGVSTGGADSATMCGRCEIERPPGAIHCTRCGVCVQKLDHHCPFMGQCVGRKTLMSFYLFVVAVWALVVYVLSAVLYLVVAVVANGY